jgi:hypothetical protein
MVLSWFIISAVHLCHAEQIFIPFAATQILPHNTELTASSGFSNCTSTVRPPQCLVNKRAKELNCNRAMPNQKSARALPASRMEELTAHGDGCRAYAWTSMSTNVKESLVLLLNLNHGYFFPAPICRVDVSIINARKQVTAPSMHFLQ